MRCLIVHPGIRGDKGPSALDWAILEDAPRWGVTLIEARAEMDAGPVWAWREFPMRKASKASLYRREVAEAAVACVFEAIARLEAGETEAPTATNEGPGRARKRMRRRRAAHRLRTLQARRGACAFLGRATGLPGRGPSCLARNGASTILRRPTGFPALRASRWRGPTRRSLSRSLTARCGSATPSGQAREK